MFLNEQVKVVENNMSCRHTDSKSYHNIRKHHRKHQKKHQNQNTITSTCCQVPPTIMESPNSYSLKSATKKLFFGGPRRSSSASPTKSKRLFRLSKRSTSSRSTSTTKKENTSRLSTGTAITNPVETSASLRDLQPTGKTSVDTSSQSDNMDCMDFSYSSSYSDATIPKSNAVAVLPPLTTSPNSSQHLWISSVEHNDETQKAGTLTITEGNSREEMSSESFRLMSGVDVGKSKNNSPSSSSELVLVSKKSSSSSPSSSGELKLKSSELKKSSSAATAQFLRNSKKNLCDGMEDDDDKVVKLKTKGSYKREKSDNTINLVSNEESPTKDSKWDGYEASTTRIDNTNTTSSSNDNTGVSFRGDDDISNVTYDQYCYEDQFGLDSSRRSTTMEDYGVDNYGIYDLSFDQENDYALELIPHDLRQDYLLLRQILQEEAMFAKYQEKRKITNIRKIQNWRSQYKNM